jgi:hypothetical protein
LSGLDQKLFVARPRGAKDRVVYTSKKGTKKRPNVRSKERTSVAEKVSRFQRTDERPEKRPGGGKKQGPSQRPFRPTKERLTERRPYDFYRDQLLWLNKTKVELQEAYGQRVTANAMVRLAVDWLMQDYRRRRERSKLVTRLVSEQPTEERPFGRK